MTEFLSRSAWTSDPKPVGAATLSATDVAGRGFALHWPASSTPIGTDRAGVIRRLQGYLRFHTDPAPGGRGWSDIAYQVAIDQAGRVWDLRGLDRRSAANGAGDVNRDWGAVLCLVGAGEQPTPAMIQAVRDFRRLRWLQRFPTATRVVRHAEIRPDPTECPGAALTALVRAGTFVSTDPITVEETDVALTAEDRDFIEDAIRVRVPQPGELKAIAADVKAALAAAQRGEAIGGQLKTALTALGTQVAGLDLQVDTADVEALAAQLAPLLGPLLPSLVTTLPPAEQQALAEVLANELAQRAQA